MSWGRRRPRGVRLVLADGREIPAGLDYAGQENGCDLWRLVTDVEPGEAVALRADSIPPRCGIIFPGLRGME